jgi:hypothetical protein
MIAGVFTLLVCSSPPSALSPGRLSVEASPPLILLFPLPPVASRLMQADETLAATESAPREPRLRGRILTGVAVGLALFGAYAYWDASYRPGRPDDALYHGLGNMVAIGLGVGAVICGGLGAYFWTTDP